MTAFLRLFLLLLAFAICAPDGVAEEHAQFPAEANATSTSLEELTSELASLRSRIEELETGRPASLDLHAFQNECNSNVFCASQDGNFCVNIGGRIEHDWLWGQTDANLESAVGPIVDGVFFRRARLHAAGTIYSLVDYYAEFEFATVDNMVFQDVWMQLRDVPLLGHIRAGHLKVPFGLENETSAKHLTFLERSAVHDAYLQEYDPGIMFWNTVLEDNLRYAVALLRFDPTESGQSFGDGEYSFASRLSTVMWHNHDDTALIHLGIGYRRNEAALDATSGLSGFQFRARPEIRNTPRFVDSGFFVADHTHFVGFEAACVLGRFSAQAEWVEAYSDDVVSGATTRDLNADGFYAMVSYFLTGEHRPYSRSNGGFGRIKPRKNVKKGSGFPLGGAWEAKARYSKVDLSDYGGEDLKTVTLGLNWYLIPNSKIMADYILADRQAATGDGQAHLLGLRFYAEF
ncbi:MAG: porin [Planctomycetota bacterium]